MGNEIAQIKPFDDELAILQVTEDNAGTDYLQALTEFKAGVDAMQGKTLDENTLLRLIRDFTMIACQSIISAARHVGKSAQKVLKPIYELLRSVHNETNKAIKYPDYTFDNIDEPDLPDFDDVVDGDRTVIQEILSTIRQVITSITDLIIVACGQNIPHAKEIAIIVNSIDGFCEKMLAA